MKRLQKAGCILLALLLLLLSGCRQGQTNTNPETPAASQPASESQHSLSLPVTDGDSLHPYKAATINNYALMTLLYDRLFYVTPDWNIEPGLCASMQNQGEKAVLTLQSGASFSDGSGVRAKDVADSLRAAKQGGYYAPQLANIQDISYVSNTVTLSLGHPDSLLAYALDVPICESNTLSSDTPVGSGRYVLNKQGSQKVLTYRAQNNQKEPPKIQTIYLQNMPSPDTTESSLKTAKLDLVYRLILENTMGGSGAVLQYDDSSYLCYMGMNAGVGILSNEKVRQALSEGIDRAGLINTVFSGNAQETTMPIHPHMPFAGGTKKEENRVDTANRLLDQAGLTNKNQVGMRTENGKEITLELLVSAGSSYQQMIARNIASSLFECGVRIQITQLADAVYSARIASGNYQLYIGEILLQPNMDLSVFFGGSASAGLAQSAQLQNRYQSFLADVGAYSSFADSFETTSPFAPICFRKSVIAKSLSFKGDLKPSVTDPFYNILSIAP